MSLDLREIKRGEHEVLSREEAEAEMEAGRSILMAATELCECEGERCPRCEGEKIYGRPSRTLYRPEEWTVATAIGHWQKWDPRFFQFLRVEPMPGLVEPKIVVAPVAAPVMEPRIEPQGQLEMLF